MRRHGPRAGSEADTLAGLETALTPRRHATIVGYAWWWRYELALVAGLSGGLVLLAGTIGTVWAITAAAATAGGLAAWPPARHGCAAVAWRIITPHRLRAGFAEARIYSRKGKLPTVVRTTRQPFGEQVRVWCPAGTSAADIRSARSTLAAACWATDVRVSRDDRRAHIATIDVIRHRAHPTRPEIRDGWAGQPGQLGRPGSLDHQDPPGGQDALDEDHDSLTPLHF